MIYKDGYVTAEGIDISYANNLKNLEQIDISPDFVIIRAGYGKNNIDSNLLHNVNFCRENYPDAKIGFYWFSYAWTEQMALDEMNYMRAAVRHFNFKPFMLAWDYEGDSYNYALRVTKTPPVTELWNAIHTANSKVKLYTNKDYRTRYFSHVDPRSIWYAYYNNYEEDGLFMQQYSTEGGIDRNKIRRQIFSDSWIRIADAWIKIQDDMILKYRWWHANDASGWFWFNSQGWMAQDEILDVKGDKYCFDDNGKMLRTDEFGCLK